MLHVDGVRGRRTAESHRTDPAAPKVDPLGHAAPVEFVFQPAAVDLVGHLWDERRAAQLHPGCDVGVGSVGEEHAQTHLANLGRAQVISQAEPVAQVVRRHLDRRLTDGVGDLGDRVRVGFDDQDAGLRAGPAQLQGEREGGDAPADDHHVLIRRGGGGLGELAPDPVRQCLPGFGVEL